MTAPESERSQRERLLEATGLQVAYGAIQVVWGVDLAVDRGQVVALIGPNGAGKTTTLRALAGLLPARQGTILLTIYRRPAILHACEDTSLT